MDINLLKKFQNEQLCPKNLVLLLKHKKNIDRPHVFSGPVV